jgi:translocation and assembly module TamB
VKKWFFRISLAFLCLLLCIFSFGFFLLGTESGAQFLIAQTEKLLDHSLEIASTKGKVFGHLEFTDITFKNAEQITTVGSLVLDWNPTDLLKKHVHILEFRADDVSYDTLSITQEESTPLILPELTLPVKISIDNLSINNLHYSSTPDSEDIIVDNAGLILTWDTNGINIQKLDIAIHEASLQATGDIKPTGNYPLHLTTTLKALSPDLPAITMLGTYEGDLQNLRLKEEISGDVTADLSMILHDVISEISWQANVEIKKLSPAVFSDIPGIIIGNITSKGNLNLAEVSSVLRLRDQETPELNWDLDLNVDVKDITGKLFLEIKQLILQHAETETHIELTGSTDLDLNFDLSLNWQRLQWPITGDADYDSDIGEATIKGNLDDFLLNVKADLAGSQLPKGDILFSSEASTNGLHNIQLTHNLLDGMIDSQGLVEWSPTVKWDISSQGKDMNPGSEYPDWPGKIDWKLRTDGNVTEQGTYVNIFIDALGGVMRNLPVSGTGTIKVQPNDIHVDGLLFAVGSAMTSAEGHLNEKSNLQWKVDIADLSDLHPHASGRFNATGTIQKRMTEPRINMKLSGASIRYSDIKLEKLDGDASLDLSWNSPFSLNLSAINLQSGENLISNLSTKSSGTREKHSMHFEASHGMADISLDLTGAYQKEKWQGILEDLNIISTDFGTWELENSVKITASVSSAAMEPLCLRREDSNVCMNGSWEKENNNTQGALQIKKVPLNWLEPWLPETVENLTGLFSGQAHISTQNFLKADVTASITPGDISYVTDRITGTFPHEGMKLTLKVLDEKLDANLLLSIDSNTLSAKLHSPNLLQKDIGTKAKLDGKLLVNAKNFDLIKTLVPEVQDLDAMIDLDFTILGNIEEPEINGKGQIDIAHIHIPAAGLDLADTSMDVLAKNKEVTVSGKFISPEGELILDGTASLDASKQYPAHATLKGENFRLVNLPDIKLFLSSDLLFEKKPGLMSLTGEATIPKADILMKVLPVGSQSVSPDVVILQEVKEEEAKSPFQMQLKITLGDDVHFSGFGFSAYIDGQLSILSEPEEQLLGSGAFHIKEGKYRAYGQNLDIETGVISFPGGPLSKPGINIRATRTIGDIVAGVYAIGPAAKPRITTFSNPPMSESHVISYLLTGSAPDDVGKGAKVSMGKQINNKLSVGVDTDVKTGDSEFITRYRLSRKVHVQTTTGANSNAADIYYTIELEDDDVKLPLTEP